jgi:hypothetical protein
LYWLGLSLNANTNRWILADGADVGNGAVSNSNPYAHWWVALGRCGRVQLARTCELVIIERRWCPLRHRTYDFQDLRTTYPAFTCVAGYSFRQYDQVGH